MREREQFGRFMPMIHARMNMAGMMPRGVWESLCFWTAGRQDKKPPRYIWHVLRPLVEAWLSPIRLGRPAL